MKRKIAASFFARIHISPFTLFPQADEDDLQEVPQPPRQRLMNHVWNEQMNNFQKSNKIVVMKWRRQDHLVNKAGHCNHVEDGHHFGVLQQKWFYLSTDENCWAKTPGDADKSGSLKTWRRSQLFWSSTASTGKLLWPLQRRTHLRISIESYQPPLTSVLRLTCKGLQWISANRWTSRTPVEHLRRPTCLSSSWTAAPWGCWPGWSRSPGWRRSCTEAWPGCPRTTAFFGVCCSLEKNEMKNYFKTRDQ